MLPEPARRPPERFWERCDGYRSLSRTGGIALCVAI
jgi:hypothetical protein